MVRLPFGRKSGNSAGNDGRGDDASSASAADVPTELSLDADPAAVEAAYAAARRRESEKRAAPTRREGRPDPENDHASQAQAAESSPPPSTAKPTRPSRRGGDRGGARMTLRAALIDTDPLSEMRSEADPPPSEPRSRSRAPRSSEKDWRPEDDPLAVALSRAEAALNEQDDFLGAPDGDAPAQLRRSSIFDEPDEDALAEELAHARRAARAALTSEERGDGATAGETDRDAEPPRRAGSVFPSIMPSLSIGEDGDRSGSRAETPNDGARAERAGQRAAQNTPERPSAAAPADAAFVPADGETESRAHAAPPPQPEPPSAQRATEAAATETAGGELSVRGPLAREASAGAPSAPQPERAKYGSSSFQVPLDVAAYSALGETLDPGTRSEHAAEAPPARAHPEAEPERVAADEPIAAGATAGEEDAMASPVFQPSAAEPSAAEASVSDASASATSASATSASGASASEMPAAAPSASVESVAGVNGVAVAREAEAVESEAETAPAPPPTATPADSSHHIVRGTLPEQMAPIFRRVGGGSFVTRTVPATPDETPAPGSMSESAAPAKKTAPAPEPELEAAEPASDTIVFAPAQVSPPVVETAAPPVSNDASDSNDASVVSDRPTDEATPAGAVAEQAVADKAERQPEPKAKRRAGFGIIEAALRARKASEEQEKSEKRDEQSNMDAPLRQSENATDWAEAQPVFLKRSEPSELPDGEPVADEQTIERHDAALEQNGFRATEPADHAEVALDREETPPLAIEDAPVALEAPDADTRDDDGEEDEGIAPPIEEQVRMVEAMLFASETPLSTAELGARMPVGCDPAVAVRRLEETYATRGVRMVRVAGKWAFRTAPDLAYLMTAESVETRKLSKAAIETLAIVAYHQPVTRAEIEEIRQVSVSKGTLDLLMELEWIKLGRRRQTPGRPVTFITTDKFLDHFGLESTKDLPGLDELRQAGLLESRPGLGGPLLKDGEEGEEPEDEDQGPDDDEPNDRQGAFV